jgi:pentose-5-phosphate-3-epimerase
VSSPGIQKKKATHLIQGFRQVFGSIFIRNITVGRMILEELRFAIQRVAHAFFRVDVLLTAVDDADEAQLQWIYTPSEDIQGVCTGIHKVKFCEYTNCAPALWIDGTGKLE